MCLHLLSTTATTGTLTRSGARSRSRVGESNRRSVLYPWINHFFNNYWRSPTPDNDTTTSPSRRSFSVRTGTLESLPLSLLSPLRGILNFETKSSHRSCTLRTMMRSYPSTSSSRGSTGSHPGWMPRQTTWRTTNFQSL